MSGRRFSKVNAEDLAEYRTAFDQLDTRGTGYITTHQLGLLLTTLGRSPTDSELEAMVREVDTTGTGRIKFDQFVTLMERHSNDELTEHELREAFKVFDKNNDGYISADELRTVLINLGEKLTRAEIDEMIAEADLDGDGQIDYEEFVKVLTTKEDDE